MKQSKATLLCSFCRRSQREVSTLINARSELFICDDCVGLCVDILAERHRSNATGGDPLSNLERAADHLSVLAFRIGRLSGKLRRMALGAELTALLKSRPEDEEIYLVGRAHEIAVRTEAFIQELGIPDPKPGPKRKRSPKPPV
jgi:ClpX C4-type zinc finger